MLRARDEVRLLEGSAVERPASVHQGVPVIIVIDYGAGNLASVRNALEELDVEHTVVNDPSAVLAAGKIILPGVGHFGQMMHALDALGLREPLLQSIRES